MSEAMSSTLKRYVWNRESDRARSSSESQYKREIDSRLGASWGEKARWRLAGVMYRLREASIVQLGGEGIAHGNNVASSDLAYEALWSIVAAEREWSYRERRRIGVKAQWTPCVKWEAFVARRPSEYRRKAEISRGSANTWGSPWPIDRRSFLKRVRTASASSEALIRPARL